MTGLTFLTAFEMPLGKAALISVLGLLIVFVVLAVLVGILTLFKYVFKIKIGKKPPQATAEVAAVQSQGEEDDDEIVAVITAAIMCMSEEENIQAPFRIKSIRKLK